MPNTALFLPWIDIEKPVIIGDVTFFPFAEAVQNAGENAVALQQYGSIYVDGYTLPLAIGRGEPVPRLQPTVAFVDDADLDARHVRDAVDVLMLATILENGIISANATTFSYVVRRIDGNPSFMIDFTPRMGGSTTNGLAPQTYFEMRPPRTGTFHYGHRAEMVDALWAALGGAFAPRLREIFDTLRTSMSESADVSMDLAESLIAKAATLLTFVPGVADHKAPMLTRLRGMIGSVIADSTGDEHGTHIARVWQAVREHRNDFWHPAAYPPTAFPFMQQRLVAPLLLALKMIHALLVCRLVDLGCTPADGDLASDVEAIDAWIGGLDAELEKGLLPVTDHVTMLARRERVAAAHDEFKQARTNARFRRRVVRHLAQFP